MIRSFQSSLIPFAHGFLGRQGGVSQGLYDSLNVGLGSGDDPAAVLENRRRALEAVAPAARLMTLRQIHSPMVHVAGDWNDDGRPEGDALVSNRPGVAIGILTADCAPILFADSQARVIGAAHAGWKGAIGGVIEATITAMEGLGACRARIAAAVGPAIGRRSYEVDLAFRSRFEAADPENDRFFSEGRQGHALFDLEGYCLARLAAVGVRQAQGLGLDTLSQPQSFFSYRRTTLAGEADYGRQLSLIAL